MFFPPILIPAYNSSSLAFLMMCSAYILNTQGDSNCVCFLNLEPFSCFIQDSNCCCLTSIQVSQETGKMAWYFHIFKSFPQFIMIHTVKYFGVVDETEVVLFVCFLFFFLIP